MSQPGLLVQLEQQITTYLTQEGSEEEHSKFDYRSALTGISQGFLSVVFLLRDHHLEFTPVRPSEDWVRKWLVHWSPQTLTFGPFPAAGLSTSRRRGCSLSKLIRLINISRETELCCRG